MATSNCFTETREFLDLFWNMRCQGTHASEQRIPRFWAKAEGEALRNIMSKLSEERNLRDLHLKHYHMSTAQLKTRTTHMDIPGNFSDPYQHVVQTCPFWNSVKPRLERSRVSGLRAEEFGDLIFLDHGSAQIGDKTFGFLFVWMEPHHICQPIHAATVPLHRKFLLSIMSGSTRSR